ncbi:phosphate ABC transporter substrate-binding protein [Psychromonas sp. psych-6C06]|uniref:phosphate ABC transporter substrate-binding protein n=1 Tax=Psychromonas sp. psych-6C06 TaxID=2058089 RepID=UPI000C327359|nr:phosphate ABC transporter substrate-binding protein [Psychromonas sp. psych-6C06]PKF63306.1 phosphate ABC transporter substrate-binding protein [Psychromonas sp. psych-6C06]
MKKVIGLVAALALITSPLSYASKAITVSGSTSVTNVMEVLGETYHNATNHNVEVQGTGSSAGIRAAKDGTSMIGMSSRDIKDDEKTAGTKEVVIARDGIAVTVNNKNSVKELSKEQIAKIYRGELKNWSEVGGENAPIVVVTRDAASGTRGAFEDIMSLLREVNGMKVSAITPTAQVGNGNGMVKTIVANNPYAIGYISLGSVDDSLRALSVDGATPNAKTIASGDYSIARPFIVLVKENVAPQATQFIEYILSNDGQQVVEEQGYIRVN